MAGSAVDDFSFPEVAEDPRAMAARLEYQAQQRRRARRVVLRNARDGADARYLLDVLGLLINPLWIDR